MAAAPTDTREAIERPAPARRRARPAPPPPRPPGGSLLFADLVWAHWAWQQVVRPHVFVRRGRLGLTLDGFRRRNGHGVPKAAGGAGADTSLADALEQRYVRAAERFQRAEGRILNAYWCASEASAVVLTERHRARPRLRWLRKSEMRIHRATEWVTSDAPEVANLLHLADALAIRVGQILSRSPRRIALEWIFDEQSFLLGFVERSGGRPPRREAEAVIASHQGELREIERFYDRAAKGIARLQYFAGMLLGLVVVTGLGAAAAGVEQLFGALDLADSGTRNFFACFGAGAIGAMVSVMARMRQEDGFNVDYEVGRGPVLVLGSFRPFLGAIFGTATYFALQSGFLDLNPPKPSTQFFFYALFAFVAGFSERFTHVLLGGAELSVARVLGGGAEEEPPHAGGGTATGTPAGAPAARPVAPPGPAPARRAGRRP